jgi:zinc protease
MRALAQRLAVVAVVLSWTGLASAQTADEIVEKSIAALGGRAAIEKAKTRVATGTISLQTPAGDIPGTIEIYSAVPNKVRTVVKADLTQFGAGPLVVDQRFDGTNGYVLDSLQGNRDITGNQLENMKVSSFPHPFLTYKALGTSVALGPKEKIGTRDAFVVTFTPVAGSPVRQFIDAETFLPVRAVSTVDVPQIGQLEQTADSSDFRDVDGVKTPFRIALSSSVQGLTITITKIENNVPVDAKLFSKP